MVILEKETEVKETTFAQHKLITQLLQSSVIKKKEFEMLMILKFEQVKTSYDASLLISYLLSSIKLRKKFMGNKARAHLKCKECGSKEDIARYFSIKTGKQNVWCFNCLNKQEEAAHEFVSELMENDRQN